MFKRASSSGVVVKILDPTWQTVQFESQTRWLEKYSGRMCIGTTNPKRNMEKGLQHGHPLGW